MGASTLSSSCSWSTREISPSGFSTVHLDMGRSSLQQIGMTLGAARHATAHVRMALTAGGTGTAAFAATAGVLSRSGQEGRITESGREAIPRRAEARRAIRAVLSAMILHPWPCRIPAEVTLAADDIGR
jgi:hypothetical protein